MYIWTIHMAKPYICIISYLCIDKIYMYVYTYTWIQKESLGLDFWSAGVNSGDLENSVGGASVFLSPSTQIMEQQDYFAFDFMRGD